MKTKHFIPSLTAALLLAAAPLGARAASLITDGDFDSLIVGTAPDKNKPAGHWSWPADYLAGGAGETTASEFSIVPAPTGGTGNALRLSSNTATTEGAVYLPNFLARSVTRTSGEIIIASFDIYVAPGHGGGAVILSEGDIEIANRGPQLLWANDGSFQINNKVPLLPSYPRGVWQTVALRVDLGRQRYDFHWSEKGQPVSVIRSNLVFSAAQLSSPPVPYINRFTIGRFTTTAGYEDAQSYFDNIRVTTDPAITPVNADLAAGGSTTLQLLNLKTNSAVQWQFNGTDIVTATNATLELSNVTADQAGNYTVVVTSGGQSVTTEASTVRVFDRLTITTPPVSLEAVSGKTTGFSVAAVGPLPMTYRWRFNGADMPDKTNRFLTFPANVAATGDYTVVVSDANGSVVSDPAKLSVLVTPTFVQAPLTQKVVAGGSVTFSAAVAGTGPFTYQWRKGSAFDTSTIRSTQKSPETTAFFTLTNVQTSQGGTYRLYVGNPAVPDITSTSPSRSFTLTVLPDTDGDGLPDEWETANGLNPAAAADALLDSDGDGISNLAEYQSGTLATNAASALRVETVAHTNGQATVTFAAVANQTYTVEAANQVSGGTWEKVADVIAQAAEHLETVTDAQAAGASRFYRIISPRRPWSE